MPDAPSVSTGVVRAPTADNRGLLAGVAELAGAGKQSMIPLEPFMAPGRGLENLGQGIGQVSKPFQDLAIARAEAQNDLDVASAQNMLAVKFAEFEGQMQNLPPQQWQEAFAPIGEQAVTEALGNEKLSPSARRRIELYGKRWLADAAVRVMTSATVETGRRAEAELFVNVQRSLMTGDIEGAKRQYQAIKDDIAAGRKSYVDPRKGLAVEADIREAEETQKKNALYDEASQDPRAFLQKYAKRPAEMSAAMHSAVMNHAQEIDRENVAGDVDRLQNAITGGSITVPEQIDEWEKDNARLTPEMRAAAKRLLAGTTTAARRQWVLDHARELASELYSKAKEFDFKKDGEAKYWDLRMQIAELPAPIEGEVSGVLERKFPGRSGGDDPAPENVRMVRDVLDGWFKAGKFGSFDNDKYVLDVNGNQVIDQRTGMPEMTSVRNQDQYDRALRHKANIEGLMRRWLEAHPDASPEAAMKEVNRILPESTRGSLMDMFDTAIQAAKAASDGINRTLSDGKGDALDLPGGGGMPSGPGILPAPGEPPPGSASTIWVADKTKTMEVAPMSQDDIDRWKASGEKLSEVWDSKASKFVKIPPSKLVPGQHYMPAGFLTTP